MEKFVKSISEESELAIWSPERPMTELPYITTLNVLLRTASRPSAKEWLAYHDFIIKTIGATTYRNSEVISPENFEGAQEITSYLTRKPYDINVSSYLANPQDQVVVDSPLTKSHLFTYFFPAQECVHTQLTYCTRYDVNAVLAMIEKQLRPYIGTMQFSYTKPYTSEWSEYLKSSVDSSPEFQLWREKITDIIEKADLDDPDSLLLSGTQLEAMALKANMLFGGGITGSFSHEVVFKSRAIYAGYEQLHEHAAVEQVLRGYIKTPDELPFSSRYDRLTRTEEAVARIDRNTKVYMVGCGEDCISAVKYATHTGAHVYAIERDPIRAERAEAFVKKLGQKDNITVINRKGEECLYPNDAVIIVAALAEPKHLIGLAMTYRPVGTSPRVVLLRSSFGEGLLLYPDMTDSRQVAWGDVFIPCRFNKGDMIAHKRVNVNEAMFRPRGGDDTLGFIVCQSNSNAYGQVELLTPSSPDYEFASKLKTI